MPNLSSVLDQLHQERRRLTSQLEGLSNDLSALGAIGCRHTRMSAAGRARIAAAQRLRWAKAQGPPKSALGKIAQRTKEALNSRMCRKQAAPWLNDSGRTHNEDV